MHNKFRASIKHLSRDKHLGKFVRDFGALKFKRNHTKDPFRALAESIIYQQISGSAAKTILRQFIKLFPDKKFPTPNDVLCIKVSKLRTAGVSKQKVTYLKDLARKFQAGTIEPKKFKLMSDAEIIEHVSRVKGVGVWTAQMFLMFTLGRPNVLPTGDLAIQKAFQKIFRLRKMPTPYAMQKLAKSWEGHHTVASFYLWRLLD